MMMTSATAPTTNPAMKAPALSFSGLTFFTIVSVDETKCNMSLYHYFHELRIQREEQGGPPPPPSPFCAKILRINRPKI